MRIFGTISRVWYRRRGTLRTAPQTERPELVQQPGLELRPGLVLGLLPGEEPALMLWDKDCTEVHFRGVSDGWKKV